MIPSALVSGNDILAFMMGALSRLPNAEPHVLSQAVARSLGPDEQRVSATHLHRDAFVVRATHPTQGQRLRFMTAGTGELSTPGAPVDLDIVIDEWRGEDASRDAVDTMVRRQLGVTPFVPRFRLSADRDGKLQVHAPRETCKLTVFALSVIMAAESRSPEHGPDRGQYRYSLEIGGSLAALYLARMTDPEPF